MIARAPAAPWSRSGGARRPRGPARPLLAALLALAALLLLLLPSARAQAAFTPPPLHSHVVDTAGKLSDAEELQLDQKLDALRRQTGFAIVAFVVGSLEGETIDDVTYKTFNTWKIGEAGRDNGVLLVIAPAERRVRIETGRGVGGALTDLQSNDIIRQRISPLLQQDRFYEAVDQGTAAIADALVKGTPEAGKRPGAPPQLGAPDLVKVGLYAGLLLLVIVLAVVSPTFRSILWVIAQMIFWSGRGGGGRGGGGFGGSGYGGGGGRSGGGGSSDSY